MADTSVDTTALADRAINEIADDLGLDVSEAPQEFRDAVKQAIEGYIANGESPEDAENDAKIDGEMSIVLGGLTDDGGSADGDE